MQMQEICAQVMIVDDDEEICSTLSLLMKREGFTTLKAFDGETALKKIGVEAPDVLMVDVNMPKVDGMEVLRRAKEINPSMPVILITGYAEVPGAVEAIKAGANDYLAKPFDNNDVIRVVRRAVVEGGRERKLKSHNNQFKESCPLRKAMGPSDSIKRLASEVNQVAQSDFTVVILGETGSGKELVAQAIYHASSRSKAPFIPIDCGAIPETLLESELFGHEKGAFTGALFKKPGKIEGAQGGTLFLDEISNMSQGSQAKLLRVIQDRTFYRLGGTKSLKVDLRLLAASNKDLEPLVQSGAFRRDLFFRLSEFTITIPPLRERKEDIPYLARRFLDITNVELNKKVKGFSESAIEMLLDFEWPGNARQLRSVIRRAVLLADEMITEEHFAMKRTPLPSSTHSPRGQRHPWNGQSLREILHHNKSAVEREVLAHVLKYTGGNKARAARLLKVDYKTLHTKVKKLGIQTYGGYL